jgi:hypothetical protein
MSWKYLMIVAHKALSPSDLLHVTVVQRPSIPPPVTKLAQGYVTSLRDQVMLLWKKGYYSNSNFVTFSTLPYVYIEHMFTYRLCQRQYPHGRSANF